ncbi:hypothetical protein BZA77DRAFT_387586 [Pyronema omphalodes]|nr:hypothetical protein BZA77DRAFT_387586 [Pyronema omphalodes]
MVREINDVTESNLEPSKSIKTHYVIEAGGEELLASQDGVPFNDDEDDTAEEDEDENKDADEVEDEEVVEYEEEVEVVEVEEESLYPTAGGAKNLLKRGQSSGRSTGRKDLKRPRRFSVQEAVERFEQQYLELEERRLAYMKERDDADRELRRRISDRKHELKMRMLDLKSKINDRKHELEMRMLDLKWKKYELEKLMLMRELGCKSNGPVGSSTTENTMDEGIDLHSNS